VVGLDRDGARLLRNIVLAVLPAAVSGLLLEHWIDQHLFSTAAVAVAAVLGGVFMLWVDRWQRASGWRQGPERSPASLKPREALLVGVMQCVAMWPGMSRSMMTIAGGYFVGLSPKRSAEFSFLVGLATLTGAGILKGYKTGPAMIQVFGWSPVLLGLAVAFVAAALSIKVLVALLTRFGFAPFAFYRFALAAALVIFLVR
jgi:undecaprenyl-diphosphatase